MNRKIEDLPLTTITSPTDKLIIDNGVSTSSVMLSTVANTVTPEFVSSITLVQANSANWSNQITISTAAQGSTVSLNSNTHETLVIDSTSSSPLTSFYVKLPRLSGTFVGQSKTIISTKDVTIFVLTADTEFSTGGGTAYNANIEGFPLGNLVAYQPASYLCIKKDSLTGSALNYDTTWLRIA
jgi:hypothetical protein